MSTKPVVKVKDAIIVNNRLLATTTEVHPTYSWPAGSDIHTSSILETKGNIVVTRNTNYEVESWVR